MSYFVKVQLLKGKNNPPKMPTVRKVWQERANACPENQRMVLFNQLLTEV